MSGENQGVYFMWHDANIMSDQSWNKYKYILCIQLFQLLKVVHEQSGKVEYEREILY
jgi:hypothetical protein